MATSEAFAPAKINLTLHVTGQRPDGYHLLDSLVVFADIGDRITVRQGRGLHLSVSGPMAEGVPVDESNLVLRAARAAGVRDASIQLDKHLPAAAGIGGGSSDAAATLRALSRSHGATCDDPLSLGADVPVCMLARTARMRGIGDIVAPLDGVPPLPAVLVNPGVSVPTPDVFRTLDRRDGPAMPEIPGFADATACVRWLSEQRNDMQAAAIRLQPVIDTVLSELDGQGALLARMSGSGATCFGLFETRAQAEAAAGAIAAVHRWWVRPTMLGDAPAVQAG